MVLNSRYTSLSILQSGMVLCFEKTSARFKYFFKIENFSEASTVKSKILLHTTLYLS